MSDTTDPQNTAAHSKTSGTQSCSHTHSHACHTHGTRKHTHTSQRERPKDKPRTLEKTRGPFHHGAGVGAGQGTEGAKGREHKLRPPPKSCISSSSTKENSFVTWKTEDVLLSYILNQEELSKQEGKPISLDFLNG